MTRRLLALGLAFILGAGTGGLLVSSSYQSSVPSDQSVVEAIRNQVSWGNERPVEAFHPPDPVGLHKLLMSWYLRAPDLELSVRGWAIRLTTKLPNSGEVVMRREPRAVVGGGSGTSFWIRMVARPDSVVAKIGRGLWGE